MNIYVYIVSQFLSAGNCVYVELAIILIIKCIDKKLDINTIISF